MILRVNKWGLIFGKVQAYRKIVPFFVPPTIVVIIIIILSSYQTFSNWWWWVMLQWQSWQDGRTPSTCLLCRLSPKRGAPATDRWLGWYCPVLGRTRETFIQVSLHSFTDWHIIVECSSLNYITRPLGTSVPDGLMFCPRCFFSVSLLVLRAHLTDCHQTLLHENSGALANISGTGQYIQNRKDLRTREGNSSCVWWQSPMNFGPLTTWNYMWVWTR